MAVVLSLAGVVLAAVLALLVRGAPRCAPVRGGDVAARLDAFWAWWATAAARLDAAVQAKQAAGFADELSERVHAIDPGLAWETGPGLRGARHHLSLSSEGDGELRVLTERWLARAPRPDAAWEFYPARQAFPRSGWNLTLPDGGGVELEIDEARVAIETDETRARLHVTFFHPALARLSGPQRQTAVFLILDNVLGEDGVERWVGRLRTSTEPVEGGKPLSALAEAASALAAQPREEVFTLLQGATPDGQPVIVAANLRLKRLDHLLLDHHVEVTIRLREPTEQGLTTQEEGDALNALEDELLEGLGHDAVYIGHETREAKRIIHLHLAAPGPGTARLEAWARRHADRAPEVAVRSDPQWDVLRRW